MNRPTADLDPSRLLERFRTKFTVGPGGCWLWGAAMIKGGYAVFGAPRTEQSGPRKVLAHRYAYEVLIGPIPTGLSLDHLCRTRHCVNPGHLEPVTRGENVLRGIGPCAVNARKVSCKRGHPLDSANTYVIPSTGYRACRTCRVIHKATFAARRTDLRRSAEGDQ